MDDQIKGPLGDEITEFSGEGNECLKQKVFHKTKTRSLTLLPIFSFVSKQS